MTMIFLMWPKTRAMGHGRKKSGQEFLGVTHGRRLYLGTIGAGAIAACLAGSHASAETGSDRILAGHQVVAKDGCLLVKISFNIRVNYLGHFPLDHAEEVRIKLRPIDPTQAATQPLTRRESLRPPDPGTAPIRSIEFEPARADGSTLTLRFLKPLSYQIGPGADFESIIVAIPNSKSGRSCKPIFPASASSAWDTTVQRNPAAKSIVNSPALNSDTTIAAPSRKQDRSPGPIWSADLKLAAAAMDEARAALKKADYPQAIRLFSKVLSYPENVHSAEAQELIGVAYQKAKQPKEARAEYEDYLQRYPNGEGAESVRQRLDGIVTADMPRDEKLRMSRKAEGQHGPAPTTWSVSGSASQFYVRDDSFRVLRDPTLPPVLNGDKEDHRIHRNALLSSFDLFGVWGNDEYKSKFRFSGTEEHRFDNGENDLFGVSALFLETEVKEWGTLARVGRQTRNTGGVLGRFDGGLVSWQAMPWLRWNVVGGSPVASRRDDPFKDEKVFYGTSVDFGPLFGGFDFSLFTIAQQAQGLIDRAAIGAEMRYRDANKSAFATVDYDVHFQEFNAAIFSGSWTLADKSTLHGGVDYRKSPYLTSWNALQGQQYLTLFDLLKARTKAEIEQMAVDRTATYTSATIGYTRPITEKLQISFDATTAHIDGTIASFDVNATPSTGNEVYLSGQLIGSNIFWPDDLFILGTRFAGRQDSNTYAVDLSMRLPLTTDWRINPRLMLSYRDGKSFEFTEVSVLPSILFNYYWTKDFSLELEAGAKWTRREQVGVREDNTDFFVTAGFRYDFYADGKGRCPTGSTACR